jgi:hypothetical protein
MDSDGDGVYDDRNDAMVHEGGARPGSHGI